MGCLVGYEPAARDSVPRCGSQSRTLASQLDEALERLLPPCRSRRRQLDDRCVQLGLEHCLEVWRPSAPATSVLDGRTSCNVSASMIQSSSSTPTVKERPELLLDHLALTPWTGPPAASTRSTTR